MEIGERGQRQLYPNANDLCTAPFIGLICKAGVDNLKSRDALRRFTMLRLSPAPTAALDAYLRDPCNDNFGLLDDSSRS